MKTIGLYCTCGAAWTGRVHDYAVEKITMIWRSQHEGNGHAPCDSITARRARIGAERSQTKTLDVEAKNKEGL